MHIKTADEKKAKHIFRSHTVSGLCVHDCHTYHWVNGIRSKIYAIDDYNYMREYNGDIFLVKLIWVESNRIKPSSRHRHTHTHIYYCSHHEDRNFENCPICLFESSMFGLVRKLSLSTASYATHNSTIFNDVPKQRKRVTKYPAYSNLDMACITFYASQTPNDTSLIERIIMNKYACMCMLCTKQTHSRTHISWHATV